MKNQKATFEEVLKKINDYSLQNKFGLEQLVKEDQVKKMNDELEIISTKSFNLLSDYKQMVA